MLQLCVSYAAGERSCVCVVQALYTPESVTPCAAGLLAALLAPRTLGSVGLTDGRGVFAEPIAVRIAWHVTSFTATGLLQYAMRAADMYAGIILIAAAGYLLNLAFVAVEHRVLHWYFASQT